MWEIQKHKLYDSDLVHSRFSPADRNGKFNQNGKFGQKDKLSDSCIRTELMKSRFYADPLYSSAPLLRAFDIPWLTPMLAVLLRNKTLSSQLQLRTSLLNRTSCCLHRVFGDEIKLLI